MNLFWIFLKSKFKNWTKLKNAPLGQFLFIGQSYLEAIIMASKRDKSIVFAIYSNFKTRKF